MNPFDNYPPIESRRARKPDKIRVERGDWYRASGEAVCEICSCVYFDHDQVRGYEWLNRTCDGSLVKL